MGEAHRHRPLTQVRPGAHGWLQAPQCWAEVWRSVRHSVAAPGSQVARPVGQAVRHVPHTQLDPLGHRRLHAPQWATSVSTETQRPSHRIVSPEHRQAPDAQVAPVPQASPQAPQCDRSERSEMHVDDPPQRAVPAGHAQEPTTQRSLVAHERPHAPQWRGSAWRSTQARPHALAPPSHAGGAVRGHPSQYDIASEEHPSSRAATTAKCLCASSIAAEDIPERRAP